MAIKQVMVFDMDGTIVDSTHRYRTMLNDSGKEVIDLDHWRANEHKAYDDKLLPLANEYKKALANPEVFVIIATARVLRDADMAFIKDKLGMPDHIVSRKDGSSISGGTLKVNGLKKFFNLKNFPPVINWAFFEDNRDYLNKVCDSLGIGGVFVQSNQGH